MLVVGLTGGIATGKSTVAAVFKRMDCAIIDADRIAREIVRPGSPGLEALCRQFGRGILDEAGGLNRSALGKIVFRNPVLRDRLNELLHPPILARIDAALKAYRQEGRDMVILDAPLLFETGLNTRTHAVVVVYAGEEVQLKRLMERDGLTREEAALRIASQMPLQEKVRRADFVIDNGGGLPATEEQAKKVLEELKARLSGGRKRDETSRRRDTGEI